MTIKLVQKIDFVKRARGRVRVSNKSKGKLSEKWFMPKFFGNFNLSL